MSTQTIVVALVVVVLHAIMATGANAQHVTKIAIVSTARSGSTLLMGLLSLNDNEFSLPEPYHVLREVDENNPSLRASGDLKIPLPNVYLDCSFADADWLTRAALWSFACSNAPWIASDPTLFAQCTNGSIPTAVVKDKCMHSHTRVVKLMNLHWLHKATIESSLFEWFKDDVKIIHIIRHPVDVLKSRARAGWVQLDQSSLATEASLICRDMLFHEALLKMVLPGQHIIVKYEDLVHKFDETYGRIVMFTTNTVPDAQFIKNMQYSVQSRFANIPNVGSTPEHATLHDIIKSVPSCVEVMTVNEYMKATPRRPGDL